MTPASRARLCAALSWLVLGCTSQRAAAPSPPEGPAAAPPSDPLAQAEKRREEPALCPPEPVRLGHAPCRVRANSGVVAERCVDGSWQDTSECFCMGEVVIDDAALEKKVTEELELEGPLSARRAREVRSLDLTRAGIHDLTGMECFHGLEELSVDSNEIEDLSPLTGLFRLRKLTADSNRIRQLAPLANLAGLEALQLSRNRILDLGPVRSLEGLSSLGVDSNCITDLSPVTALERLENLNASYNYIPDLKPLIGKSRLKFLFVSGNPLTSLQPLAGLYELRNLFVTGTSVEDVTPLTNLVRFDRIVIQRNRIDCDAQAENIRLMEEHAKLHGGQVTHDCTPKRRRARRLGLDPLGLSKRKPRIKSRDPRCKPDETAQR